MPRPRFGGAKQDAGFYVAVSNIINGLREHSTLTIIASHLSAQGFLSPSGMPFNKSRVATFLRSPYYTKLK